MPDIKKVVTVKYCQVRTAAGYHGAELGYVGQGEELQVDYALEHDGWVPIVVPNPWYYHDQQAWIKTGNITPVILGERQYLLKIPDGGEPTLVRIK